MKLSLIAFFGIILITLSFSPLFSQNHDKQVKVSGEKSNRAVLESFNKVDADLINGYVYQFPNPQTKGHPYLENDRWYLADLFINGTKYPNQWIKYDLTIDDVVLKAEFDMGKFKLVELNKYRVDSFILNKKIFINSKYILPENKALQYYEFIADGNIQFYKRYTKSFIDKHDDVTPYGKFSKTRENNYMLLNEKMIKVNRQRDFLSVFEKADRKKIRTFLSDNGIRYNNASPEQLKQLINYCNTLISD